MTPKTAIANLLVFVILMVSSAFGSEIEGSASGVIKGRVRNKTAGEKAMAGIAVTLYQHFQDRVSEISRSRTDETGGYVFRGIQTEKNQTYHTSGRYKDVVYFSELQNFKGKNEINLDLAVFEPTDQKEDIRIKMHHILMETVKEGFGLREIMIIENKGNRTYVGAPAVGSDKRQTLRVSLPAEAIDVQLMNPSLANTAAGLIDTSAIIPGTKRVLFSYFIQPPGPTYKFEKDISLDTERFNFILPENGVQAFSDQLEMRGPEENSGQRFYYLAGDNLKQGSRIVIELNRPKTYSYFKLVVSGLVALVIAAGFVLPLIKNKGYRVVNGEACLDPEEMNLVEQRKAVLQAIAEWDGLFESGEMNASTYQIKRAELLNKAKTLTRQLRLGSF